MVLKPGNIHLINATTIHPKAIKSPLETNILKSVSLNGKMGKGSNVVTKGKWAGMPMFQMSLIERTTCPDTCQQWASCFANNMGFGHRIDHTHPEFLSILGAEVELLAKKYQHGVVIRPHVIGDYYSAEYAQWWMDAVEKHKSLHLFGFTHRLRDSDIGRIILKGNEHERVWIRFSDQGGAMSANVAGEGIPCPEQTKKTESCLTCGVCWSTTQPVAFKLH